jgi:multiple sugar transport system ATP-binding protein
LALYEKPVNMFVAGFIGTPSMNFLKVAKTRKRGKFDLRLPNGVMVQLLGDGAGAKKSFQGEEMVLGLRPEDIRRGKNIDCVMTVRSVEPLGSHTLALGRIGNDSVIATLAARDHVKAGDMLPIEFNMSNAHLFQGENGMRIL